MHNTPVLGNLSPLIPAGSDADATRAFYTQKLGFTTINTVGDPPEMAIIQREAVQIFLCRNDDQYVAEQYQFPYPCAPYRATLCRVSGTGRHAPKRLFDHETMGNPRVCHPRSYWRLYYLL
jgi:hypothetical protein